MLEHVAPGNSNLVRHIREAAESIVLNTSEAPGDGRPGKMANYFHIASGSASECCAGISALISKKAIDRKYTYKSVSLLRCLIKMLTNLANHYDSLTDDKDLVDPPPPSRGSKKNRRRNNRSKKNRS